MTSYQRLKKRLHDKQRYWLQVECIYREYIIALIILRYKESGVWGLPLIGRSVGGNDFLTHIDDSDFILGIVGEAKKRIH